ncbi:MAG: hypothetical protein WA966_11110 [Ornithinimicrobium sp.]
MVPQTYRVSGLERWEGYVVEVDGETLTAELTPEHDGPVVLADFEVAKLGSEPDLAVGDVVYVTVRSVAGRSGYPTTTSAIRLRRLGRWSDEEVDDLERRADERAALYADFVD